MSHKVVNIAGVLNSHSQRAQLVAFASWLPCISWTLLAKRSPDKGWQLQHVFRHSASRSSSTKACCSRQKTIHALTLTLTEKALQRTTRRSCATLYIWDFFRSTVRFWVFPYSVRRTCGSTSRTKCLPTHHSMDADGFTTDVKTCYVVWTRQTSKQMTRAMSHPMSAEALNMQQKYI